MCAKDPSERISVAEIMEHPWYTKENEHSDLEMKQQLAGKLNEIRVRKNEKRKEAQVRKSM